MPNTKNILIFLAIGAVFVSIYIFFIKKPSTEDVSLVSSSGVAAVPGATSQTTIENQKITQEFLSLLMNVKNIKLNSEIFDDPAFDSLYDSSITLVPDGNEGRVNPFAQFGKDVVAPTCVLPKVLDTLTNTCVTPGNPAPTCVLPKVLNVATNTCVTPVTCVLPKVLDAATNTCVNPPTI